MRRSRTVDLSPLEVQARRHRDALADLARGWPTAQGLMGPHRADCHYWVSPDSCSCGCPVVTLWSGGELR